MAVHVQDLATAVGSAFAGVQDALRGNAAQARLVRLKSLKVFPTRKRSMAVAKGWERIAAFKAEHQNPVSSSEE